MQGKKVVTLSGFGKAKNGGTVIHVAVGDEKKALCDGNILVEPMTSKTVRVVTCKSCMKYAFYRNLMEDINRTEAIENAPVNATIPEPKKKIPEPKEKSQQKKKKQRGGPKDQTKKPSPKKKVKAKPKAKPKAEDQGPKSPTTKEAPIHQPDPEGEKKPIEKFDPKAVEEKQKAKDEPLALSFFGLEKPDRSWTIKHMITKTVVFDSIDPKAIGVVLARLNVIKTSWEGGKPPKGFISKLRGTVRSSYRELELGDPFKPIRTIKRRKKAAEPSKTKGKRQIKRREQKENKRKIKRREKQDNKDQFGRIKGTPGSVIMNEMIAGITVESAVEMLVEKFKLNEARAMVKFKGIIRKARQQDYTIVIRIKGPASKDHYQLDLDNDCGC